jgi:hypothetical protein
MEGRIALEVMLDLMPRYHVDTAGRDGKRGRLVERPDPGDWLSTAGDLRDSEASSKAPSAWAFEEMKPSVRQRGPRSL